MWVKYSIIILECVILVLRSSWHNSAASDCRGDSCGFNLHLGEYFFYFSSHSGYKITRGVEFRHATRKTSSCVWEMKYYNSNTLLITDRITSIYKIEK